jgi:hypothetical protein
MNPIDKHKAVLDVAKLIPDVFNKIYVTEYSGDKPVTIVYKQDDEVKATLTITYDGDNITSIVRT